MTETPELLSILSASNAEDYDEDEHVKETFAYFGRAYYLANVFEVGLALALMQLEFLSEVKAKFTASGGKDFDRAQYEADFDQFMDRQHAQSLGNLIRNAKKFPLIDQCLGERLAEVKKRRDFLAHHFFRERSVEFASRRGRDSMIAELEAVHGVFLLADRDLDNLMEPIRRNLGFDEEMIKMMTEKFLQEAQSGE